MTTVGCKIEGCSNKSVAKGLCAKHYMRQRRTGDAEQVRRPGRKPDPRLSRLRATMGPNFGSRSTFYRYDLAIQGLASLDGAVARNAIRAATRPHGSINVSKLLELAKSAAKIAPEPEPEPKPPASALDDAEHIKALRARAKLAGYKLLKASSRPWHTKDDPGYLLTPINDDEGGSIGMVLSMVPQHLDIAEGKLYMQMRTFCGMTEPFEEQNKQRRDEALARNPSAKPLWVATG